MDGTGENQSLEMRFAGISKTEKLEKLQKALEEKTERWLYLTELQEKIEAWEAAQKK